MPDFRETSHKKLPIILKNGMFVRFSGKLPLRREKKVVKKGIQEGGKQKTPKFDELRGLKRN